jgi:hypothetical protein
VLERPPRHPHGRPATHRHAHRVLGEAVGGAEGRRFQPARRERVEEGADGVRLDWLGGAHHHLERREVPGAPLLRRGLPRREHVSEVRRRGVRGADAAHHLEPDRRAPDEGERREQPQAAVAMQRAEDAADQAEVMEVGNPDDGARVGAAVELGGIAIELVGEVAVRDHHAARRPGRTGRVLENRQIVGRWARQRDLPARRLERVGHEPVQLRPAGSRLEHEVAQASERACPMVDVVGQRVPRPRVARERGEAREIGAGPHRIRRRDRDGDDAGHQATGQRGDELQRRQVDEHDAIAGLEARRPEEVRRHAPRRLAQPLSGQPAFILSVVVDEREQHVGRGARGALGQSMDDRRGHGHGGKYQPRFVRTTSP